MRGIILIPICAALTSCGILEPGTKGGLLRITLDNQRPEDITLVVSSVLHAEFEVEDPPSRYTVSSMLSNTILHGFACRRYGDDATSSTFTFHMEQLLHCTIRVRPGCAESPIDLQCTEDGCTMSSLPWNQPWPLECE